MENERRIYIYAPMLRRLSPMAFDFREQTYTPLTENTGVLVGGSQYTWPGAGGLNRVDLGLVWQTGRFTLMGSGFAGRYYTPFNPQPAYTAGVNLHAMYQMNDWI